MTLRWVHIAAYAIVMIGWLLFIGFFVFGKKSPREKATRIERLSLLGIVLQGLSYAPVWALQRPHFTSIVPLPGLLEVVPPVAAVALELFSVWFGLKAIRTLGKEWSYEARLIEGHRLVTAGPYKFVRHPIYTGMLGKLLATGLVLSHWIGLLSGIVIFAIGTAIRVRSEEKLLRSQFGPEYEEYARRVPAILPRLF